MCSPYQYLKCVSKFFKFFFCRYKVKTDNLVSVFELELLEILIFQTEDLVSAKQEAFV